ncbi:MAG TPA: F0F1 ATP synthase subunit B [Acidocella sp.]|nr:F0F1 ATP synthase subunit B [Acidocella sp.]
MNRLRITALLSLSPTAAFAEGTMPQMDFHNPLTSAQVLWMVVIMVVLYLLLSRWGLPEMGKVLENRAAVIARDLAAARSAKTEADQAVAQLNATITQARKKAHADVADMIANATARAAADAAELAARLDKTLGESEERIEAGRVAALAAIKPVAEATASSILLKLTGSAPGPDILSQRVDDVLAARKAA